MTWLSGQGPWLRSSSGICALWIWVASGTSWMTKVRVSPGSWLPFSCLMSVSADAVRKAACWTATATQLASLIVSLLLHLAVHTTWVPKLLQIAAICLLQGGHCLMLCDCLLQLEVTKLWQCWSTASHDALCALLQKSCKLWQCCTMASPHTWPPF